jgi:hypothetical protein
MDKFAAEIVSNTVTRVLVTPTLAWVRDNLGGEWVECKMDASIRGCYPGPGYTYDRVNDVFVPPLPSEPVPDLPPHP